MRRRIGVVGGGITGVSTAYFLRLLGHDVSVLEKLGRVCVSTSFATAGALSLYDAVRPSFSLYFKRAWKGVKNTYLGGNKDDAEVMKVRLSSKLVKWGVKMMMSSSESSLLRGAEWRFGLAKTSQELVLKIGASYGIDLDPVRGHLFLFRSEVERDTFLAHADKMKSWAPVEVLELEPSLRFCSSAVSFVGGGLCEYDVSVDPYKFITELAQVCETLGVKVILNVDVTQTRESADGVELRASDGRGFEFDQVVFCTGSELGDSGKPCVNIVPMKGHSVTIPLEARELIPRRSMTFGSTSLLRMGDHLRVTTGADFVGNDWTIDRSRVDFLLQTVGNLFPRVTIPPQVRVSTRENPLMPDKKSVLAWTGLRPMSPDLLPSIGLCGGSKRVFVNGGHGTLGWTIGLGVAQKCAQLIHSTQ